jgi:hypothetical protein
MPARQQKSKHWTCPRCSHHHARASDTLGSGAFLLQLGSGKRPRIQRSGTALTGKKCCYFWPLWRSEYGVTNAKSQSLLGPCGGAQARRKKNKTLHTCASRSKAHAGLDWTSQDRMYAVKGVRGDRLALAVRYRDDVRHLLCIPFALFASRHPIPS